MTRATEQHAGTLPRALPHISPRGIVRSIVRRTTQAVRPHISRGVWTALERLRFEIYLQRVHRKSVAKVHALDLSQPVRLNLGCGTHPKKGWINVDLGDGTDLQLDLREPLPFPESSVTEIYAEHFVEHLDYPGDAFSFLRECHRVLVPGGRIDLAVPDAELALREYAAGGGDRYLGDAWWGPRWCDTLMHQINYVFRQGDEHRYAYDFETLKRTLETGGFRNVARRPHDPTRDHRNPFRSLIVVAEKP
jgi:predicted SAM-dependent methyltransferase